MPYFVIHSGEDGIRIEELDSTTLQERISPKHEHWDGNYYGTEGFAAAIPTNDDGYFSGPNANKLLIIKGDIVIPKEVSRVTEYELP